MCRLQSPAGGARSRPNAAWPVLKNVVKWPFYPLYEYRMAQVAADWRKPQHIGVIMDGNRRFARQYGFTDLSEGHEHGARHLYDVLKWCRDFDIRVMTVWALSLDNFSRDPVELDKLFELFETKFREIVSH